MIRKTPSFDGALTTLSYKTRCLTFSMAGALLLALIAWNAIAGRRRIWAPAETAVAFWSWRYMTPPQTDVNEAVRQTGAKTLFLRAGQIDYDTGKLRRIRPLSGPIPSNIEVHFVYNATRSLLREFEQVRAGAAGDTIIAAFDRDLDRARGDHAQVVGLQLDFDVPTRLLPNYTAILKDVRARLSSQVQLSITGLPTWLNSPALVEPLSACDFWAPQCYGAQIPERLDQRIPITTPEYVAQSVSRTRDLGLPFYAGLAAYGYAIHYSREGSLIALRGDLDPLLVVASADFELSDQTPFFLDASSTKKKAGEWRSTYRARRDVMVDGTPIRAGESLVLDRPTAAGLRACARKVREQAGARLLGICVFRIPTKGDSTTLTLPEIASALSDVDPRFSLEARVNHLSGEQRDQHDSTTVLELENNGAAASRAGEAALTVLVRVPAGSLESVSVDQFASAVTVFESAGEAAPCALKRANAVKLSAGWWPPGAALKARLETRGPAPNELGLRYAAALDDGSVMDGARTLTMAGQR